MRKYILIIFLLFINNSFAFESYYNKLMGVEKSAVNEKIKECVSSLTKDKEKIDDRIIKTHRFFCEEFIACIYYNFGYNAMMQATRQQYNYCWNKVLE